MRARDYLPNFIWSVREAQPEDDHYCVVCSVMLGKEKVSVAVAIPHMELEDRMWKQILLCQNRMIRFLKWELS